jgi:hypothetical membrane protein
MNVRTKILLSGLFLGPLVLTLTWAVLGYINTGYDLWDERIETYSVIAQPISGLGLGNTAPYMNTAFIVSGILIVFGSIGFSRMLTGKLTEYKTRTALLLSLVGIGAALCGIFNLESFMLHTLGFMLALSPIVSFIYLGRLFRRERNWRAVGNSMLWMSPILLVLAIAYFASFNPERAGLNEGYAGLTERILLAVLLGYYSVLGMFAIGSKDWK